MLAKPYPEKPEGFFKIGITSDIAVRLSSVQVGCPHPIRDVLLVPVGRKIQAQRIERGLHEAFDAHRSSGEWFRFDLTNPEHKKTFNKDAYPIFFRELGHWKWVKMDADHVLQGLRPAQNWVGRQICAPIVRPNSRNKREDRMGAPPRGPVIVLRTA